MPRTWQTGGQTQLETTDPPDDDSYALPDPVEGSEGGLPPGWTFDGEDLTSETGELAIGTEPGAFSELRRSLIAVTSDTASLQIQHTTDPNRYALLSVVDGAQFGLAAGASLFVLDADGNVLMQITEAGAITMPALPTADPTVAGQLWNDAGTLKVSAGA